MFILYSVLVTMKNDVIWLHDLRALCLNYVVNDIYLVLVYLEK